MKTRHANSQRGSALLLVMIMLLLLAAVGAATVSLSTQERTNAAAVASTEFLEACANAAQGKIWAEMAQYGMGYLGSAVQVTQMTLPDGTTLAAPAHMSDTNPTSKLVQNVVFQHQLESAQQATGERDCTNGACGMTPLGSTFEMTAVCTDARGRKHELELSVKFAL